MIISYVITNTTTSAPAAVTMIMMIIITTSITTPVPEKSAALVITSIIRQLRLHSQGYVLRCLPSSWDVVPDWERESEDVAEALNLLRRPQSPWTTLNGVSFGMLGLTHTEREAVYEAFIDLTQIQLEKAESVLRLTLTRGDNLYTIGYIL